MTWRPLNTLTGRMVLVTIAAVALSYAAAYLFYAHERGAALRGVTETAAVERIAFTAERLRGVAPERRAIVAAAIRDFSIRYQAAASPEVAEIASRGPAERIARGVSERLGGAEVRARARTFIGPTHHWRMRRHLARRERELERMMMRRPIEAQLVRSTEVAVSVALDEHGWLNARARLPTPRPPPLSLLAGALASVFAVGLGAALIGGQIGRPLADLARAASALGAGQANVSAPVSGPEDVRRASIAFNAMAQRLERQLTRQREMLWALSHDLRTPITALKLRAELIEDETVRQRLAAPLEEMERLTEQALALARAGASREPRARVDLSDIARTLCGELQDLGLDIRVDADASVEVECRPSEIARALRNLAENAAKYAGGGVLRICRDEAGDVVAEVLDDGPGVREEILSKLAAPFYRADPARAQADGAGLGLAIAQAIAEGHGGRLVLANRSPHGFSAQLVLPR